MFKHLSVILLVLSLLFVFPAVILAHDAIFSAKKFVGDKVVLINLNVDYAHAGLPIQFNIRLYGLESGVPIDYQKLQLEFKRANNLVYSQEFEPKNTNEVDTTYTFPQAGDYQMGVKFIKEGTTVTEATFPIPVERKINTATFSLVSKESSLGFLTGLLIGIIVFKKNRENIKKWLKKINLPRFNLINR